MDAVDRFHWRLELCRVAAVPVGFGLWFLIVWLIGVR